jgi:TOBE domain
VLDVQYHGASNRWLLRLPGDNRLVAMRPAAQIAHAAPGTRVKAQWPAAAAVPLEE